MGEDLIASDTKNQQSSIFVHFSAAHEHSITTKDYILANTSTLAGDYAIIYTIDLICLPLLTFDDSLIHHESIVWNE